jgi:hypothetical protein
MKILPIQHPLSPLQPPMTGDVSEVDLRIGRACSRIVLTAPCANARTEDGYRRKMVSLVCAHLRAVGAGDARDAAAAHHGIEDAPMGRHGGLPALERLQPATASGDKKCSAPASNADLLASSLPYAAPTSLLIPRRRLPPSVSLAHLR